MRIPQRVGNEELTERPELVGNDGWRWLGKRTGEKLRMRTGFLISSDGNLKSCSDLTNVRPNSRSSQNDGSLKDLSHGWKTSED